MRRILFVPVIGQRRQPLFQRILAQPFLWQADRREQQTLQKDWLELTSLLRTGQFGLIDSLYL